MLWQKACIFWYPARFTIKDTNTHNCLSPERHLSARFVLTYAWRFNLCFPSSQETLGELYYTIYVYKNCNRRFYRMCCNNVGTGLVSRTVWSDLTVRSRPEACALERGVFSASQFALH